MNRSLYCSRDLLGLNQVPEEGLPRPAAAADRWRLVLPPGAFMGDPMGVLGSPGAVDLGASMLVPPPPPPAAAAAAAEEGAPHEASHAAAAGSALTPGAALLGGCWNGTLGLLLLLEGGLPGCMGDWHPCKRRGPTRCPYERPTGTRYDARRVRPVVVFASQLHQVCCSTGRALTTLPGARTEVLLFLLVLWVPYAYRLKPPRQCFAVQERGCVGASPLPGMQPKPRRRNTVRECS
jgi:hypothetical protein